MVRHAYIHLTWYLIKRLEILFEYLFLIFLILHLWYNLIVVFLVIKWDRICIFIDMDTSLLKVTSKVWVMIKYNTIQGTIHYGISSLYGNKICLSNIRPWNAHIKQFLSGSLYACHSSLLCFVETHLNSRYFKNVIELKLGWSDILVLFEVDNNKDINEVISTVLNSLFFF